MKILVIEDEKMLQQSIKESLEKERFLIETADDFHSAIDKISFYEYDCVLLDIMLPNGSGLEVLDALKKQNKNSNVIIISAKDSLDDKLAGLDLGADDYLTKPFHLAELNARIKAVLRRKNTDGRNTVTALNCELNLDEHSLYVNGNQVMLTRKEFDILHYFLLNKNRLVTKSALAEHVWGDNVDQADNFDFIYSQIKNLRKKLQENQAEIQIESVYGVGYKMDVK